MKIRADSIFYKRFSPRSFRNADIDDNDLMTLFEAARWAASSFNEQPWRFIYARKHEAKTFEKLLSCLSKNNEKWAKDAPILMLTVAKTFFSKDKSSNPHAKHDLGLAMGNLTIQASKLGIMVHQMAGFDSDKAKKLFELPEGFAPVAMVALGYANEGRNGKSRKSLEEIVFQAREKISDMNI